ncbi:MAG: hypothetical protein C5B50_25800 [Verrucomicrobia bacterium]|nr:MAG: hypothetical protein C5B50_25800 [Verrucomicrobiota bacterium]
MSPLSKPFCCLAALAVLACRTEAQPSGDTQLSADKGGYNFFNPTPANLMREMSIDGPGATESPYTVDAGHFQIELDFVFYTAVAQTFDGDAFHFNEWDVAPMNLKVGLLNDLDLQVLLEPYIHQYERDEFEGVRSAVTRHGFGDTTVRLKYNVWGNDHGPTALGLTPFVTIPTSQNGVGADIVQGGLIVPFAAKLPWDAHLGLTSRFVSAQDILGGRSRHEEYGNSILLARPILRNLEPYVEFASNVSTEQGVGWVGSFDSGLMWWLTDDLQLNAGANIGMTKWADNWEFFAGLAWRY